MGNDDFNSRSTDVPNPHKVSVPAMGNDDFNIDKDIAKVYGLNSFRPRNGE